MLSDYKRIERQVLADGGEYKTVAFEGQELAFWGKSTSQYTAYLTPKESIAIISETGETTLEVFESFEEFEERQKSDFLYPEEFASEIANALDKEYTEELDI